MRVASILKGVWDGNIGVGLVVSGIGHAVLASIVVKWQTELYVSTGEDAERVLPTSIVTLDQVTLGPVTIAGPGSAASLVPLTSPVLTHPSTTALVPKRMAAAPPSRHSPKPASPSSSMAITQQIRSLPDRLLNTSPREVGASQSREVPSPTTNGSALNGRVGSAQGRDGPGDDDLTRGSYRAVVGNWIRRFTYYPSAARHRSEEGIVRLRVAIREDGTLVHAHALTSAQSPRLDAAALEIVRRASPFPPPPGELHHRQVIEVDVPIRFALLDRP